jgi:lipid-binding SYLF domain-containing protein
MRYIAALIFLAVVAPLALAGGGNSRSDDVKRLKRATEVFGEIMGTPDKGIPQDLLDKAACVAIVPGLTKGAIGIGGRYGKGIVMCRKGGEWTAPAFLTVEGGSFGFQLGLQKIDVVMLIMNQRGMDRLIGDKFTIGADASAAAGPVGRQASASTDIRLDAEILTYSRAKGLFAGISLDGAVVKPDKEDNREFYGKEIDPRSILMDGAVPMPPEAKPLAEALSHQSPSKNP